MKQAQVTMFMIFGIILLFLAGFVFYGYSSKSPASSSGTENPVENYIGECMKSTAGYATYLLGIHGGRIYDADNSFVKDYYNVSYGFETSKVLPSLIDSKLDAERYIDENLNSGAYSCVKDLRVFNDQYDKITVGPAKSEVIFSEDAIIVKVNMTVSLQKQGSVKNYEKFTTDLAVRYKRIHGFADVMLDSGASVPISQNGVGIYAHLIPFTEEDVELYALTDDKSRLNNKDYVFLTAVKGLRSAPVCG